MNFKTIAFIFSGLACCALTAAAQQVSSTQPGPAAPEAELSVPARPATAPASPRPLRDPTQADPALKQVLAGAQSSPTPSQRQLPQITRRGLIVVQGSPPAALIEVHGSGIFPVHAGDNLTTSVNGVTTSMMVRSLSPDVMEIFIASQNVSIIIR